MRLYDDGHGNAAASLHFYRDHAHLLGPIVGAQVWFPGLGGPYPYCMVLHDRVGQELWLSGAAAGYPGEAPRVAMQILVEAGFPAEQAAQVFDRTALQLTRPAAPAPPGPTDARLTQSTRRTAIPRGLDARASAAVVPDRPVARRRRRRA